MKPTILSLHPTFSCMNKCVGCYLKKQKRNGYKSERHILFFQNLIEESKNFGFEEVAVAINRVSERYGFEKNYKSNYLSLKEITKRLGMMFTVTSNYEFALNGNGGKMIDTNGLDLISISINEYATDTESKKDMAILTMKKLKESGVKRVNANVLLSEQMVKELKSGLMDKILKEADTVYLLLNKPTQLSKEEAGIMFISMEQFLMDERIILDSCFRCANDLTGGICDRHNTIYVNPYGEVGICPYDSSEKKFALAIAKKFEKAYNEALNKTVDFSCNHLFKEVKNGANQK